METFLADVQPAVDGLEWKTVAGEWLVSFPTEIDVALARDISNLVKACQKGWVFLSLEPNRKVQLPCIVTGEPVPEVQASWQRTVRLVVLPWLVASTPLASVVELALVPPATSMDAAQGVPEASTVESFVEAKFL